jgi:hypothetical protein
MRTTPWVTASLATALVAGVGGAAEVQATPSTSTSTVLAQATVAPIDVAVHNRTAAGKRWRAELETRGLSDGYVVDNVFQPGQSTGWHSHPGPSLIFVVSGSVTNYDSHAGGCRGVSHPAGTSFVDPGGRDVHMLRDDADVPAETIAVQLIPNGLPRRVDQPAPNRCGG